jgi:hypothetical protein
MLLFLLYQNTSVFAKDQGCVFNKIKYGKPQESFVIM